MGTTTDIEEVTFRGNYSWESVDGMAVSKGGPRRYYGVLTVGFQEFPNGSYLDGGVYYFIDQNGTMFVCSNPAQMQGSSSNTVESQAHVIIVDGAYRLLFKVPSTYDQCSGDVGGTSPPQQHPQGPENTQARDTSMVSGDTMAPLYPLLLPPPGELVPQTPYGIMANNRRGFNAGPPIMFVVGDRSGISLQSAMDECYKGLLGRDDGMFVGSPCTAISLRIQVGPLQRSF